MKLADHHGISIRGQLPKRTLCRLACAIALGAMVAGPGSAFAANCSAVQTSLVARVECQIADQKTLLGYSNTLPGLTGGAALVTANLQTEENIYLNSTQQQKIASGTVFIIQEQTLQANILLRAFPGNPNYLYNSAGLPTAPELPASVTDAVKAITENSQVVAMKPFFGKANVYGCLRTVARTGQLDRQPAALSGVGREHHNPFTAANSSPLAAANQQTNNGYGVNWLGLGGSDTKIGDYPTPIRCCPPSTR